jgi:hypothetical protein
VQGGDAELQEPRLLRVAALPGPVRGDGPGAAPRQPPPPQPRKVPLLRRRKQNIFIMIQYNGQVSFLNRNRHTRIPDSHPHQRILIFYPEKLCLSSRKYKPECSSRILIFHPSRIQGSKRYPRIWIRITVVYKRHYLGLYCTPSHLFLRVCPMSYELRRPKQRHYRPVVFSNASFVYEQDCSTCTDANTLFL